MRWLAVVAAGLCCRVADGGAANSATGARFSGDRVRSYAGPTLGAVGPVAGLPSLGGNCTHWGVVTTIYEPSRAIALVAALEGWCVVVVGDESTPADFAARAGRDAGPDATARDATSTCLGYDRTLGSERDSNGGEGGSFRRFVLAARPRKTGCDPGSRATGASS